MIIRKASLIDAEGIAKVHVDSWRTTYENIIPKDYLDNLSYNQRADLWKNNIRNKENFVIVAENDEGQIIGFADAWKRENNNEKNSIDLTSIYLFETDQGKGIGKMLLKELFEYFKKEGYRKVYVEVLEENKTRLFYEYYGAKLVDTIQINIGGVELKESMYRWDSVDEVLERLRGI